MKRVVHIITLIGFVVVYNTSIGFEYRAHNITFVGIIAVEGVGPQFQGS